MKAFMFFQEEDKDKHRTTLEDNLKNSLQFAPKLLQKILSIADTDDQRLMAAPALLTITGVCFPNCTIRYAAKSEYACLYQAVIAPAGSGKGIIPLLAKLLDPINEELEKENALKKRKYKSALNAYKAAIKKGTPQLEPDEPVMKRLIIPGDISSGQLSKQLSENQDMTGITIVSEADTIGLTGSQSFAKQNSTIMRLAYENELVSNGRLYEGGSSTAQNPKYSIIIAGTRDQFQNIFRSATDGLYSRFLITSLKGSFEWRDVKPCYQCLSSTDEVKGYSEEFSNLYKEGSALDTHVKLTDTQWEALNAFGKQTLSISANFINKDSTSLPKRHCVMVARMSLILTMVRSIEHSIRDKEVVCSDDDFNIAMGIAQLSLYNSLELFKTLPSHTIDLAVQKKTGFLRSLPDNFDSATATAVSEALQISKTTRKRYITDFIVGGLIKRAQRDYYEKTPLGLMDLMGSSDLSDNQRDHNIENNSEVRSKGPKVHPSNSNNNLNTQHD